MAYQSLGHFTRQAWLQIETRSYVHGWHLDAICEHLEAVSSGQIRKLMINMPPRHMKSLGVCVFWPAWDWLRNPRDQFLYASYAETLSIRDSVKCRRLIQSPYYTSLLMAFQPDLVLVGDQNTKIRFENNFGGYRIATSVDGSNTGEGGDKIIVDDAHNLRDVESPVKRISVIDWWWQVMSTRLNDPKTGSVVIIMQRSHEADLCGEILEKEDDWNRLILPAEYEGSNKCCTVLGFKDPRNQINEPLWKDRFGSKELGELKRKLGTYGAAGQLQQRPSPREGGMFKITAMKMVHNFDRHHILNSVRYWDKAATEGTGCNTAGVLMHQMKPETYPFEYLVEDVVTGQWSTAQREAVMKQTAELDRGRTNSIVGGKVVKIWLEQEPGSGGKDSSWASVKNLKGFAVSIDRASKDKVVRAEPFSAQVEIGNVGVMVKDWTDDYLQELELFPVGKEKDRVDASTGAFNRLNAPGGLSGTWGRKHGIKVRVRRLLK